MSNDPYAGRDTRSRLIAERQGFERIEPLTRRTLLVVAVVALAAGAAQLFTQHPTARAQPLGRGRASTPAAE